MGTPLDALCPETKITHDGVFECASSATVGPHSRGVANSPSLMKFQLGPQGGWGCPTVSIWGCFIDDSEIGIGEREVRRELRELDDAGNYVAVGIVEQRACGGVVDDAVVGVGGRRSDPEGAGRKRARGGQRREVGVLHADRIGRDIVIGDGVQTAKRRVEQKEVVAAATRQGIVAAPAGDEVGAGISVDGVGISFPYWLMAVAGVNAYMFSTDAPALRG